MPKWKEDILAQGSIRSKGAAYLNIHKAMPEEQWIIK